LLSHDRFRIVTYLSTHPTAISNFLFLTLIEFQFDINISIESKIEETILPDISANYYLSYHLCISILVLKQIIPIKVLQTNYLTSFSMVNLKKIQIKTNMAHIYQLLTQSMSSVLLRVMSIPHLDVYLYVIKDKGINICIFFSKALNQI